METENKDKIAEELRKRHDGIIDNLRTAWHTDDRHGIMVLNFELHMLRRDWVRHFGRLPYSYQSLLLMLCPSDGLRRAFFYVYSNRITDKMSLK